MPAPPTAIVAVIALLGGAAAGVGLERAGVLSPLAEPEAAVVRADRVAVLDCPEGSVLTALGRGDRVLATGRSADDDWVEIRSPLDLDARAWLPVGVVSGDEGEGDLADLPVRECEQRDGPTTSTSSTTTSSTSTSTSTTLLEETTTTEPPPDETTTTAPPDITPPVLTGMAAANSVIVAGKDPNGPPECASQFPLSTIVSVTATDDSGVTSVSMTFRIGNGAENPMSVTAQGNTFSATLGPFPGSAIPDGATAANITVTAVAFDGAQNQSAPAVTIVQLRACGGP